MSKLGVRSEVAKRIGKFLKTAQAEEDVAAEPEENVELPDPEDLEAIDEDEGVVEEDEKEEEEDEEVFEKLDDKLDSIDETLESVVDALEDHKEILEKTLLDETEMEEKFENYKEDEAEELEEEFSAEEFGLDTESTKEDKMAASLREKRNARLKKANLKKGTTLNEEFNEPASTKKKFGPSAPAPTITKVKKDEVPTLFKLADLSMEKKGDDSAWLVLNANDEPLYEIPRGEIDQSDFDSKEFAVKVFKEMASEGIGETLVKYDAIKATTQHEEQDDEVTYQKAVNDVKRRYARALRLAANAMNKNLLKTNPLKSAFFGILSSMNNIGNPEKVIENAFAKGAVAHFETMLAQAEKYMGMSDEAFIETESMVGESEINLPKVQEVEDPPERVSASESLKRRASRSSMVLSTATDSDHLQKNDRLEALNQVLPKPQLHQTMRTGFGS